MASLPKSGNVSHSLFVYHLNNCMMGRTKRLDNRGQAFHRFTSAPYQRTLVDWTLPPIEIRKTEIMSLMVVNGSEMIRYNPSHSLLKPPAPEASHGQCAADALAWGMCAHWHCTRERLSFAQTRGFTFPKTQVELGQSGIVQKGVSLISRTWAASWLLLPLMVMSMHHLQVALAGLNENSLKGVEIGRILRILW